MPWVAPVVALATTAYGAVEANKARKAQNKQQEYQRGLVEEQRDAAGNVLPRANTFLDESQRALSPLMKYYSNAMRGDPSTLFNMYRKDIGNVGQGYDQATSAVANYGQRGSTGALAGANIPFERTRAINEILLNARGNAAQGLAGLFGQTSAAGSSLMGTYMGGLGGAANTQSDLMTQMLRSRAAQGQEGEAIGKGLIDAILGFQGKGPYATGRG